MRYFYCKNEDGRAMLIPFIQNEPCVDSTWCCYDYTLLYGVLFVGAMEVYVGESRPLGSGAMDTFSCGVLFTWDFTFYLSGDRYL